MSAHTIATETLIQNGGLTIDLAKALHTKYPELPSAEDMINHPDFAQFFKNTIRATDWIKMNEI